LGDAATGLVLGSVGKDSFPGLDELVMHPSEHATGDGEPSLCGTEPFLGLEVVGVIG